MEVIDGKITEYTPGGEMTVKAKYLNLERFMKCGYCNAKIILRDSRTITQEQRKKIHAMLAEIGEYMGEYPDIVKKQMKLEFKLRRMNELAEDISFSGCCVELAAEFIDFLVEFIIAWEIPLKTPLIELCEDIRNYVYISLKYKKCAVCGRDGELHHVDAVGMSNDRKEIVHEGMQALCLCRKHHTQAHNEGDAKFMQRYHLEPVRLDKRLCGVYKLKKKEDK